MYFEFHRRKNVGKDKTLKNWQNTFLGEISLWDLLEDLLNSKSCLHKSFSRLRLDSVVILVFRNCENCRWEFVVPSHPSVITFFFLSETAQNLEKGHRGTVGNTYLTRGKTKTTAIHQTKPTKHNAYSAKIKSMLNSQTCSSCILKNMETWPAYLFKTLHQYFNLWVL